MRKLILLTLTLLLFSGSAYAAEYKMGVFSLAEVIRSSDAYNEVEKQLESKFGAEEKKLRAKEEQYNKNLKDYQNKLSGLSADARENKEMELLRQKRDFEDQFNSYRRKRGIEEEKVYNRVTRAALIAVTRYGKANKYSLILNADTGSVLHADPTIDISKDLIAETNKVWKEKPKQLDDNSPILTGAAGK